ncbi:unnamed protein product [Cyprideis torosa]|uniref:Uncharacterized protein n=1 Tax=Cyprideis torosa TaxID=163714 RepID=A0A7R8WVR7_9CRUS|nr:unnamed protein product [Cyprideis torosa]CAG0907819.1 unnamed protein product [Cyprideis torosa]
MGDRPATAERRCVINGRLHLMTESDPARAIL